MDAVLKKYILAAACIVSVTVIAEAIITPDWLDHIMVLVAMLVIYPAMVGGLYMFLEGKGSSTINGVDFSSISEQEKINFTSYFGIFMTVGMILMMIALGGLLYNWLISMLLIVLSVSFVFIPIAMKSKAIKKPFVQRNGPSKVAAFMVCSVLAIVPMIALSNMADNSEVVTVEFYDDHFTVKAPMVSKSYDYSAVSELSIDPDFDKGTRVMGYGTPTISSGTFKNAAFGSYTLASYTKVKPCIFFEYEEGKYFAFNQSTAEATQNVFEKLQSNIPSD